MKAVTTGGTRRASVLAVAVLMLATLVAPGVPPHDAAAKSPGHVYCYHRICHRVHALEEVTRLIGLIRHETASFYATPGNRRTSSGEQFDAASRYRVSSSIYPDGTELLLWNPVNGRAAHVRVNDLGPFHGPRTLDLTRGLADDLGVRTAGVADLKVFVISAPAAHEAEHNRTRVFAPTTGYVGTLDETRAGELADDLVDQAWQRRQPEPVAAAADGRVETMPEAETPPVTIADAASEPAPGEPAPASTIPPAAQLNDAPAIPQVEVRTTAVAAPAPAPDAAPSLPVTAASAPIQSVSVVETAALPAPQHISPRLMNAASPAVLIVALLLTYATLRLYRLRRAMRLAPVRGRRAAGLQPTARLGITYPDPGSAIVLRRVGGELSSQPPRPRAASADSAAHGIRVLAAARRLATDGRHVEADTLYRRALAQMEASLGPDHCALARPMRLWADSVRDSGRHADALQIYARALDLATRACAPDTQDVAAILTSRARLHLDNANAAAALADADRAAGLSSAAGSSEQHAAALLIVAEAAHGLSDATRAEAALTEILRLHPPETSHIASEAAVIRAALLAAQGSIPAARTEARAALFALDRHLAITASIATMPNDLVEAERRIEHAVTARRAALELLAEIDPGAKPSRPALASLIESPRAR